MTVVTVKSVDCTKNYNVVTRVTEKQMDSCHTMHTECEFGNRLDVDNKENDKK